MRVRPDLTVRQQRYLGEAYWVVKEPVGLNYFRFHEEEFAILQMLDGQISLEEIKEQFEQEFAPQKITYQDLQQFIGMLHRSGLVISESAGQGRQLRKRRDEKKRKELLGKMSNIFAIRFRGIDPERFLNWTYPMVKWMFHPAVVFFCLALAVSALLLVIIQFDIFRSRLPTFHEFFGRGNWFYLAITMGVVKVLHELGHGLSCKHFGGECHEIGVMILVFTPCLYCNVSDSWMLPSKYRRAMIGAAGMYVEMILASIATFLWWFSDPTTLINQLSLSVMFICSVSTLVFNGNPLLRFDGYYILMDLAEIPNLRQKSTEVLKRFMVHLCLGLEQPENPFLPESNRFLFGLYTVAAVVYRWVVVFSIVWFLNMVLEPYGLKVLGQLLAAVGFFGLVVQPLYRLGKFFYTPGRMHKVKRLNLITSIAVVGAVLGLVIFLPLPYSINCAFQIAPRDAAPVYVDVRGQVESIHVENGAVVQAGDSLLTLRNHDLELAVIDLQGELTVARERLRGLERRSHVDDTAGMQIQQAREIEATIEKQLREKEEELSRLNIVAPVDGIVLPVETKQLPNEEGRLPQWSGSPLDPKNLNATYQPGELICRVGDPQSLEAELVVDQADIDLLDQAMARQAQPIAVLQFDAFPGRTLTSRVVDVARDEIRAMSPTLSSRAGGDVSTQQDRGTGQLRPLSTSYQARVPLDDQEDLRGLLTIGQHGSAKVYTRWQSLGQRLYRFVARTFHFDM
ncbi:MAG: biotin/lipoyl-binding protein [Planctomycetaceae bacterium]|nr:MAG: biotin/lipoyl-binding protein [Planctomycetaceae bacterium]